jgi:hypothetical protein
MDPFSRLSLDQLAHLLSHVDIKPRLSSCSLVSSTWRTAAARATTSIKVERHTPLASFEQWLWAHTARVQVSSLTLAASRNNYDFWLTDYNKMLLPVAQLQSVHQLDLSSVCWTAETARPPQQDLGSASISSDSASNQGLATFTALTWLILTGNSVRLAGLSALTGLQELSCERYAGVRIITSSGVPAVTDEETDLVAAFPQLQRLTSLTLRCDLASTAVVSQLSHLHSLQKLEFCDPSAAADNLAELPQSLTWLHLVFSVGSSTASDAAGLSHLTALRHASPLDLALLVGMCDLRSLHLFNNELAAGGLRLQLVSSFTALTGLRICSAVKGRPAIVTAAEAGALTSSSQLAELHLSGWEQLQDYASLFPPRRQLQHLTELLVSGELLFNSAAVCQAGSCCPNLHSLKLAEAFFAHLQRMTSLTLQRDLASTAIVSSISALQSLQQLELCDTTAPADSFAVLPQSLTQLCLSFKETRNPTASNAAGLSRLTALQSLYMRNVAPLDCALLAGMRDLRCLQLFECELAAGGLRLQVVSSFTALTCLKVARVFKGPPATVTAAEADALTASSQLAELTLSGLSGQPQAYASLFPPGRQLRSCMQHLTMLVVSGELPRNSASVRQAGSCCPNLQSLTLTRAQHNVAAFLKDSEAAAVADSLAAMSAWSSLRQLQLHDPWLQMPPPLWQALGTLSQLTALRIFLGQVPAREDVLHLTSCTALRALTSHAMSAIHGAKQTSLQWCVWCLLLLG